MGVKRRYEDAHSIGRRRTQQASRLAKARGLVEFGWVRELNEGVKRIYTEMQRLLLNDPTFNEPDGSKVQLTLENNIVTRTLRQRDALEDRIAREVLIGLNEYELAAVQAAYARGRVTPRELASLIGRSQRSATRVLKGLLKQGIMEWHGTSTNDPVQYYTVS